MSAFDALPLEDQQSLTQRNVNEVDVIASLLQAAKTKQDECEQQQWKLKFLGKHYVLHDIVGKIVRHLEKFRDIGGGIVAYDPGHFALPWVGVKILLQVRTR